MERARPVVAAEIGGLGELVVDGETGLLVPSGEAEPLTRVRGLCRRVAVLPLLAREPVGAAALSELTRPLTEGISVDAF